MFSISFSTPSQQSVYFYCLNFECFSPYFRLFRIERKIRLDLQELNP